MNVVVTIIVFILIFSLLILIHEFGHFIVAKRAGIKVEEFGFGLPPRLWGKKKGETIYSINWIPFGGFVRMLGEDSSDPKALRQKRSFIAQPMRVRVKVIVAGVVMNFLLAWLLITIGFTVGMEPLLAANDILPAIDSGMVVLQEGAKIKTVDEGGLAHQLGMQIDDTLFVIDDQFVNGQVLLDLIEDPSHVYRVLRDDKVFTYELSDEQLEGFSPGDGLGVVYYDYAPFPRVKLFDVNVDSDAYKFGLRPGDTILTVNGTQVFHVSQYEDLIRGEEYLEYEVVRNGRKNVFEREVVIVEVDKSRRVIISSVLPGSPAEEVGIRNGDIIVAINGKEMRDSQELIAFVGEHSEENLAYLIERDGVQLFFEVQPEDGKIGVFLSELVNFGKNEDLSVYNINLLSSVTEIKDQQYPFYIAPFKAVEETWRLSKLTVGMFGDFLKNVVRTGEIPETVAGPVGIAQLTHGFVQEGFISVLRFVAILSLSLAVMNILPIPALDGGRLLFIIIEFVMGRRVNQKWEAVIHAFGYVLILLMILAVTYSDIIRLFGLR